MLGSGQKEPVTNVHSNDGAAPAAVGQVNQAVCRAMGLAGQGLLFDLGLNRGLFVGHGYAP